MKNDALNQPASDKAQPLRSEEQGPRVLAPLIMAMCVIVMITLCLASTAALMSFFAKGRPLHHVENLGLLSAPNQKLLNRFPKPNLELDDGHADSTALVEQQKTQLNTYGWVDRSNNIVHIPIERAIDLMLAQGLPTQMERSNTGDLKVPPQGGMP